MSLSDFQQVAERLQCAVCFMGQYAFREHFAQLDAFLVKAVQVPQEALEHDLVFIVGQQGAKCFRRQLVTDDDTAGPVAGKVLVPVLILLAAGKSHDLGSHVGAQLLLACAALDCYVRFSLAVYKSNELQRNDIGSLVQELIEGMLAVGTGFTEDDGSGGIIHGFSPSVYALAV